MDVDYGDHVQERDFDPQEAEEPARTQQKRKTKRNRKVGCQ